MPWHGELGARAPRLCSLITPCVRSPAERQAASSHSCVRHRSPVLGRLCRPPLRWQDRAQRSPGRLCGARLWGPRVLSGAMMELALLPARESQGRPGLCWRLLGGPARPRQLSPPTIVSLALLSERGACESTSPLPLRSGRRGARSCLVSLFPAGGEWGGGSEARCLPSDRVQLPGLQLGLG